MRLPKAYQTSLIALCVTLVPGVTAAAVTAARSPIEIAAVSGAAAVRISGTADGGAHLQADLYASFGPELPDVFVNRRPLQTDAAGRFAATISIAPAYFEGTLITVIVRTTTGLIVGRGSIRIADPGIGQPGPG